MFARVERWTGKIDLKIYESKTKYMLASQEQSEPKHFHERLQLLEDKQLQVTIT